MTEKATPARLPYTPPTLTTFGSLTQVTRLMGAHGLRDGGARSDQKTR